MSALVLAVDTTSAHGSVALLAGDALRGIIGFETARPRHAENLLPSTDELLAHTGATLSDVDAFAVAVGPGSFTGLRIGIAAVEGLAYALGKPAVGVSALDATAYRYRHRRGVLVAMLEAYRSEVYAGVYRSNGATIEPVGEPTCRAPKDFLDALAETPELVAGSATVSYGEVVRSHLPASVTIAPPSFFIGEEVARLGARDLEAGKRAPLGGLDALYIRPSEAERNRRRAEST